MKRMIKGAALMVGISAIALHTFGQTREGHIVYSMQMDTKQEMPEAMKKMRPTEMHIYMKNNTSRVKTNASMMNDMLQLDGVNYQLDATNKVAMKMPEPPETKKPKVTVEKTNTTLTIANQKCTLYKITQEGMEAEFKMWCADDIKFTLPKSANQFTFGDEIKTLPLKTEMSSKDMKMVMTATMVDLKPQPDDLFKIPKGYEISEFNPFEMMKGLGGGGRPQMPGRGEK